MKTTKIIYYISTALLTLLMLFSAGMYLFNHAEVAIMFTNFGYPTYIIYPYAIAKILGLVALWFVANKTIKECQKKSIPTVLLGVTFALLDLAEKDSPDLSNIIVMETGGMKGRRKEITRTEMHDTLCKSFNINEIHTLNQQMF